MFPISGYHFTAESISSKREHIESTATTYHRVIEAMKFSYSTRMDLGDPKFSDVSEVCCGKLPKDCMANPSSPNLELPNAFLMEYFNEDDHY